MQPIIYPLNVKNNNDLSKICARIKSDTRAFAYLAPKANIMHFYAENVDYRAAAFLKQELLARGGDAIVTKHVIDGKADYSDVLLMATASRLRSLLEKLKAMDCWGLKELRESLSLAFRNINHHEWVIASPAGHKLILNEETKLMAIINLTPDSFYAESRITETEILRTAEKFLSEGAEVLDIGAESTRPGSKPVSEAEELERLLPGLRILRREFPEAVISVDTYKPEVAWISANEGTDIINDISGFTFTKEMPGVIASLNIPYILSHIKGTPENMANHEPYKNLLGEIHEYFAAKLESLKNAGVKLENIILDPGIGFGKSGSENLALIKNIESLKVFGLPVLAGLSRKKFTGQESLAGTLAVTAMLSGRVSMLRVHDVKENLQALKLASEINYA